MARSATPPPPPGAAAVPWRAQHDVVLVPSSPILPAMPPLKAVGTPRQPRLENPFGTSSAAGDDTPPHVVTAAATATRPPAVVVLDSTPDALGRTAPAGETQSRFFAASPSVSSSAAAGPAAPAESTAPPVQTVGRPAAEAYVSGDLPHAVSRRRDWTPPPVDSAAALPRPSGGASSPLLEEWSSPSRAAARPDVFKSLQNSFGCTIDDESGMHTVPEVAFAKRRPIEAIRLGGDAGQPTPTTTTAKAVAPKRKPRTLTERAVAAYADVSYLADDAEADTARTTAPATTKAAAKRRRAAPKRQLEAVDEADAAPAPVDVRPGLPLTKLRKLKTTTASAKKAPRKKAAPRPKKAVLLSPASAQTESMRQDFLFGTSSQLASEQSPTFLRHLHVAMQESNQDERNSLLDLFANASAVDLTSAVSAAAGTVSRTKKARLWGASARDADGSLTFESVVALEGTIEFPEDPHQVIAMAQRAAEEAVPKAAGGSSSGATKTCDSEQQPLKQVAGGRNRILPATQPSRQQKEQRRQATPLLPSTLPAAGRRAEPGPAASQASKQSTAKPAATAASAAAVPTAASTLPSAQPATEPARPNFDLLTTAQLTKKVTAYGYKPMRSRSAMVALLKQCWDAQNLRPPLDASALSVAVSDTDAGGDASAVPASQRQTSRANTGFSTAMSAKTAAVGSTSSSALSRTAATKPGRAATHSGARAGLHTTARTEEPAKAAAPSTGANHRSQGRVVYEIEDSEASDGRLSSPEVPCSIASDDGDLSVASDSDDGDGDEGDGSLAVAPTGEEAQLFHYITQAVVNAPPSADPASPSWHEKMLLYDTIILETFTAWLNEDGQLRAAGYEGAAATAAEVKKWCESKSVCCTWRMNLHGRERKR